MGARKILTLIRLAITYAMTTFYTCLSLPRRPYDGVEKQVFVPRHFRFREDGRTISELLKWRLTIRWRRALMMIFISFVAMQPNSTSIRKEEHL